MPTLTFAILKERKAAPDSRVVFSPVKLREAQEAFPQAGFIVEASDLRVFPDVAYEKAEFTVLDRAEDADVFLGVKEVPAEALVAHKSYVFFSHTIKKQEYNRELLQQVLKKKITLYDHELFTTPEGERLIGFGYFAGLAGAYNGFRALGMRTKSWVLPKTSALTGLKELKRELDHIKLPTLKILLTGTGRVSKGVREILEHMNIREVSTDEYLENTYEEPVFCNIDVLDYNKPKEGGSLGQQEFFDHPEKFESDFLRFAGVTDFLITGHFYDPEAPVLFTKEDSEKDDFKISVVADISCDINGPVASTIRSSTGEKPFYGYDCKTGKETAFDASEAITVMAVDNLPCELAREASVEFGNMFMNKILPAFFNEDADGILDRACIAKDGKLTPNFEYLQDFVDGKE